MAAEQIEPTPMGPPPVPHQVRSISVRVEQLDGALRISSPSARGWAAVARNAPELLRAINALYVEVQVASYAAWKGQVYDLDELTDVDPDDPATHLRHPARRRDRRTRSDIRDPRDWKQLDDGRWRSPAGRTYRPDTMLVQRVVENRRLLGLE
jgi:hypothetical protein